MAGGDQPTGSGRRMWALGGGAAVLAVAAIVAVVVLTGDSDPADRSPEVVAGSDAPSVTTGPATEAKANNEKPSSQPDREPQEESKHDGGRGGGGGETDPSPKPSRPDPPRCPKGLSNAQCAELAAALEAAGVGTPVKEGQCPPGLTNDQCDALGEAYRQASEGSPIGPNECPPGLTREQCAALAG